MIKKSVVWGVLLCLLGLIAAYLGAVRWYDQELQTAKDKYKAGEWGAARIAARSALQVAFTQESRDKATLLLARASLSDETLNEAILKEAISSLEQIGPNSSVYADAIAERAKQLLFAQIQVRAAERILRDALRHSPDHLASNQLMFMIYCLTNRPDRADAVFWTGFRQTPAETKVVAFRQWFLSQFTLNGANRSFDIGTGIVPQNREPSNDDIIQRFIAFRDSEPNESAHYGAMAGWWLSRTETKTALELLQIGQERSPSVANEVYLSSLVQALLNQGNFEQVGELLEQWPEDERSFIYLRHLGVYQESVNQTEKAVETYKKCLDIWPGPIDANVRHRLNQCLKDLGHPEEAEVVARQTEVTRYWLENRWGFVRNAMEHLQDERSVRDLLEFFTAIGKQEAVDFLNAHLADLQDHK